MKKHILLTAILAIITTALFAQDYTYKVTVLNNQGRPYSGVKIWFQNKISKEQIVEYTNKNGKAEFHITTEGVWAMSLVGMHDTKIVKLVAGQTGSGSQLITYDLETIMAEQAFKRKRALTDFETEEQNFKKFGRTKEGMAQITVELKNEGGTAKGIPVALVSVKDKKIYKTKTGKDSKARFFVPNGQRYAIDVEGAINFSFTSDLQTFTESSSRLTFVPTNIVEHNNNDTITQEIKPEHEATSTRTFVTLKIFDGMGGHYQNEPVFLKTANSNIVYKGETDENGEVSFLIPNGNNYLINFKNQSLVDAIALRDTHGQRTIRKGVTYNFRQKMQNFQSEIPTADELFLVDINSIFLKDNKEKPAKTDLKLTWGNSKVNSNSLEAVLLINLEIDSKPSANTKPANIAFVIDKSGSMYGENRIDALKESMIKYVSELSPKDKVSLITFESEAYLETDLQNAKNNKMLIPLISDIQAGGGTNIYNGMCMGYEQLEKNYSTNRNNILILLTDGYGSMPIDTVVQKSKEYNQKGISLTAIGVGEDYNHALLTLLTQESGTLLQHAGKSEDIYTVFSGELKNAIYPVGTDAKIEIEYNEKIVLSNIFGMAITNKANNLATINVGNVFAGKKQIALIKFNLKGIDKKIGKMPVKVNFSYKDNDKNLVEIKKEARLEWSEETGKYELIVNNYQKKLYAIATMNQGIKLMTDQFYAGEPEKALKTIKQCKKDVEELAPDFNDAEVKELFSNLTVFIEIIENYIKENK